MPAFTPPTTAAHVRVTATARAVPAGSAVTIHVHVDRGFHINANPATSSELIATTVTSESARLSHVDYPPPHVIRTAWARAKLAVYDNDIVITARASREPASMVVRAQACTAHVCLPPSDIRTAVRVR